MTTATDVARHVTEQWGSMSAMKLQKLLYYVQGWTLVATDGTGAFEDRIEAWEHGPVVRELWYRHRGQQSVSAKDFESGAADAVSDDLREIIAAVMERYAGMTAAQLRAQTHRESPWIAASGTGSHVITDASMQTFFSETSLHDDIAVSLPAWSGVILSEDEYDDLLKDVAVPDDASSLLAHVRAARRAQLA